MLKQALLRELPAMHKKLDELGDLKGAVEGLKTWEQTVKRNARKAIAKVAGAAFTIAVALTIYHFTGIRLVLH